MPGLYGLKTMYLPSRHWASVGLVLILNTAEIVVLFFYFVFVFIQFYVPFKIISLIETSQSIGGAKREYPGKTT